MKGGPRNMHTEKLYYQDQYLGRFTASILKSSQDENGRYYVVLNQTAFYPTGGGQPHDTGTLDGKEVYDVEEVDGELRHFTSEPIALKEACVGEINWERRMDHMQQHAGQHILSAAFEEEFGYKTVSFHLGQELCSIDLEVGEITDEEANEAERIANLIVLENRPIETKWVQEEEIHQYKLRKKLAVTENIRLVIIPDFDYNGCGGTHPKSTGQVGSIEILHWEKQKKNTRVYFVCGDRVRKQLHEKHSVLQKLTSLLSAPQEQLEEAASRVLQQVKDLEKTIVEFNGKLIDYEAADQLNKGENFEGYQLIKSSFVNRTMLELQQLAKAIAGKSDTVIALLVNETDDNIQIVCSRGKNVTVNMNQLIKKVLPNMNGKGGGNESVAQGGGEKLVSSEQVLDLLSKAILE
jgi:alanyl-tRNA synthetase